MDSLTDIYQLLRCEGLCATQADFSRDWMGRSAHYLSQIDGDPAKASPTSLQLLASRLDTAAEAAREQWSMASHRRLQSAFDALATFLCEQAYSSSSMPYFSVRELFE